MNYAKNNKVKGYTEKMLLLDVDRVLEKTCKNGPCNKVTRYLNLKVKVHFMNGVTQEIKYF